MDADLVELTACPACGGELLAEQGARREETLRCEGCDAPYPVLAGVPILVADPSRYLAEHHDAVLATLAAAGHASKSAMRLLSDFASRATGVEARTFGDDWVAGEAEDGAAGAAPVGATETVAMFGAFLSAARATPLEAHLAAMLPETLGTVVEVGPGAGALSVLLRPRADRLILADWSLRAVMRAREAASRALGGDLSGVVCDAESLPFASSGIRTLAAANVIDLLDRPAALLSEAARVLARRGRLLLSSPAPELGLATGEPVLAELASEMGFRVRAERDGLPWVRAHGARHFQVYFVHALYAERA